MGSSEDHDQSQGPPNRWQKMFSRSSLGKRARDASTADPNSTAEDSQLPTSMESNTTSPAAQTWSPTAEEGEGSNTSKQKISIRVIEEEDEDAEIPSSSNGPTGLNLSFEPGSSMPSMFGRKASIAGHWPERRASAAVPLPERRPSMAVPLPQRKASIAPLSPTLPQGSPLLNSSPEKKQFKWSPQLPTVVDRKFSTVGPFDQDAALAHAFAKGSPSQSASSGSPERRPSKWSPRMPQLFDRKTSMVEPFDNTAPPAPEQTPQKSASGSGFGHSRNQSAHVTALPQVPQRGSRWSPFAAGSSRKTSMVGPHDMSHQAPADEASQPEGVRPPPPVRRPSRWASPWDRKISSVGPIDISQGTPLSSPPGSQPTTPGSDAGLLSPGDSVQSPGSAYLQVPADRRQSRRPSQARRPSYFDVLAKSSSTRKFSTASNASISSIVSVSASSLRYFITKPPVDNEFPFLNEYEDPDAVQEFMDLAREQGEELARSSIQKKIWKTLWLAFLICCTYFGFIGYPLWNGVIHEMWIVTTKLTHISMGFLIFLLWAASYSWIPLLFTRFEQEVDDLEKRDSSECCVVIPAYKAAGALPETIKHALKIFKPEAIFVIANGNSPTPLDETEDVCKEWGVNHAWVPVGSKITAEFIGVLLAKDFKYIMLIDDDVHLPANLPLVTDRFNDKTKCIGYTIKSTGANGARGTFIQQCQDLEYKLSGLSRTFAGTYGSTIFPHGAIILWDRDILEKLFWAHPGFAISEDWYFGHTARSSGYRIQFCSQVFVETETPPSLFLPAKSTRGGYGEMTVWKQRFYRWNFFFIYRLRDNISYLLFAWRLGRYEFVTKIFVLLEVYNSLTYFMRPFMLPIAFAAEPKMTGVMTLSLMGVYLVAICFFNSTHLRRKNEMVAWKVLPVYFAMKFALTFVNTLSIYYALYQYANYFSERHPRVVENPKALDAAKMCVEKARIQKKEREKVLTELVAATDKKPTIIATVVPSSTVTTAAPSLAESSETKHFRNESGSTSDGEMSTNTTLHNSFEEEPPLPFDIKIPCIAITQPFGEPADEPLKRQTTRLSQFIEQGLALPTSPNIGVAM